MGSCNTLQFGEMAFTPASPEVRDVFKGEKRDGICIVKNELLLIED